MDFLRKRLPAQVGRYLEGVEFPARKEELLGRLERNGVPGPVIGQLRKEAPGRRVPRPPGGLVGPARGALADRLASLSGASGSSFPRANFLELSSPKLVPYPVLPLRADNLRRRPAFVA